MALSACIDDALRGIACFSLRALGLFARARADDPLLKHPLCKLDHRVRLAHLVRTACLRSVVRYSLFVRSQVTANSPVAPRSYVLTLYLLGSCTYRDGTV